MDTFRQTAGPWDVDMAKEVWLRFFIDSLELHIVCMYVCIYVSVFIMHIVHVPTDILLVFELCLYVFHFYVYSSVRNL